MIKLFRFTNSLIRLCEQKQNVNVRVLNKETLNSLSILSLFPKTNTLEKKYYSTTQLLNTHSDESTENNSPDVEALSGGNPELEQKLKVIVLETEVMRQEGRNIPSNLFLKENHWQELLKLQSRNGRRKYLEFLFKLEKTKENFRFKKEQKRLERQKEEKPKIEYDDGRIVYGLSQNNIFLRVYETTMNHFYNGKLIEAVMFGQKLVIDCGYDQNMTSRENINCAKQLMLLFGDNRIHEDPFNLYFCNFNKESVLGNAVHKQIKTMYEPWFPLNVHEESYCDIFPKEKLVYLTPHCREEMTEYDHDATYIIGGIVDKTKNEPLSLAKAKKENLKMLKLPLDKYLQWGSGSGKSLTLNQVLAILLDLKKTNDWTYALRHVPRRKIVKEEFEYPNITKAQTLSYDRDNTKVTFNRSQRKFNDDRKFNNKNSFRVKYTMK